MLNKEAGVEASVGVWDTVDDSDFVEVVAQHGPFELTATGARAVKDATFDEWSAAVTWAQQVEKASPFWVGDLLAYGDRFGEESSQVLDATEYAEKTCANAKFTCERIPPERRRLAVRFSHHQDIANLPTAEEQDKWLKKCEDENLTREQLRAQLKVAKAATNGTAVELWLVVRCTDVDDQSDLADRMKAEGRSVRLQVKDS
jgi:hypothetical protein